jgi:hypothetical protein
MKKSELLNGLQEEYQQWEAFLDQIGPARMDQPGVTARGATNREHGGYTNIKTGTTFGGKSVEVASALFEAAGFKWLH